MYGAIQERDLTGPDQYTHQRSGSGPLCEYLSALPQLPTDPDPDIVDEWEFEDFVLRKPRICCRTETPSRGVPFVPDGVDKATPAPGVLALHEHNDEYLAGKSETVGLVEDPEYTYLRAVHPDPSHEPPDAKRQFAYGRDPSNAGMSCWHPIS